MSPPSEPSGLPWFRARSGRWMALSVALMLASPAALAAPAQGAPALSRPDPGTGRRDVERDVTASRDELATLSAESAAALSALNRTRTQLTQAQERLAAQTRLVAQSEHRLADTTRRLEAAKGREAAGLRDLAANATATQAARDQRDNLARVAYEGGGGDRLALFFDVDSAYDLAERAHLIDSISDSQGAAIDNLGTWRAAAIIVQQRLVQDRREVAQLTLQSQAQVATARRGHAEIVTSTAQLRRLENLQGAAATAVAARKDAEQRRLSALEAESDRLARVLAARAVEAARLRRAAAKGAARKTTTAGPSRRSRSSGAAGSARLGAPVSAPMTSSFGMRFHPILGYSRLHAGADFGAACGAPVYAAAAGQIVSAGPAGGYGNRVVIDHDGSLATSYNHLSSIAVSSGGVSRGQFIGRVGTTGLSTGCHLHFEVRVNGRPVDPAGYR